MSDLPRGWTLSVRSTGGTASIVVPAVAGVVHVLDAFQAKTYNGSAGAQGFLVELTSSDGVYGGLILADLETPATNDIDTASASGLDLAAGPGASLTIAYNAGAAGVDQDLLVQGHDI